MPVARMESPPPQPREQPPQGKVVRLGDVNKTWGWFKEKGWIDSNKQDTKFYQNVKDVWKGQPAYIIGAGPPLRNFIETFGWEWLRGRHTIGINHTIEDWDGFEWFFFLDQAFLKKTTYKLDNYKGRIFAQNNTGLKASDRVCTFKCRSQNPGNTLDDGLYSANFSGLASLNLALITGANPIYLIGFGMGKAGKFNNYHYKKEYISEIKNEKTFNKFKRVNNYYKAFRPYQGRIWHLSDGSDLPFRKLSTGQFRTLHPQRVEVSPRVPRIIHYSFSDDKSIHADITRAVIDRCYGRHEIRNINEKVIPPADLYIMEHFISTNHKVNAFPYKSKAIDIVHSQNCHPKGQWGAIIALTEVWKNYLKRPDIQVIQGGIDLKPYENIVPTEKPVFGRITRWSRGKIHPEWAIICHHILESVPEAENLMYVDFVSKTPVPPQDPRIKYDLNAKISDFKGQFLRNMSVYCHFNGGFKETMSHAVIEAMATGLPIVYLDEPAVKEVVGPAGICCPNMLELQQITIQLLNNLTLRKKWGRLSKERSRLYNLDRWVREFDSVIKKLL